LARLGLLDGRRFAEVSIWRDGSLVHRLIVTPRWFRFPFMSPGELQIGDLWTRPGNRGQGLAHAAIGEVHRLYSREASRFWYVVAEENAASIALIESCGYELVGVGRRTAPAGIRLAGRFEIESTPLSSVRSTPAPLRQSGRRARHSAEG
jgi:RimJ/RimL family protein N-acetyltransferase